MSGFVAMLGLMAAIGLRADAAGVKVYEEPGWCVWCPSAVALPDGRFALVHSRWREADGFEAWCARSEAALAVSETGPLGPYRFVKTILPGSGRDGDFDRDVVHNPQVLVDGGKYYLFYMGTHSDLADGAAPGVSSSGTAKGSFRLNQRVGVAWADRIEGPWHRTGRPVLPESEDCIMASNPAVVRMPDGRFLMVYKWGWPPAAKWPHCRNSCAAAVADSPLGPWKVVSKDIFPVRCANFPGEDPCLWLEGDVICCSIHDNGRFYSPSDRALVTFESRDGIRWTSRGELFPRGDIERLERPFVLAEPDGRRLLFAASKPRGGSPHAEIRAFPGSDSGCAYVNAAFNLRATCRSALQTGKANDYFMIAQSKRYTGDLTVRYAFLSGEQADYNGMAAYVQRQIFGDSEPLMPEAPPVVTEYVGLIRKTESFLGLSYEKKVPMTTFAQVAEHTADLQANGLRGLRVKLSGWFGGGYLHGFAGGARAERALGGLAGAQALAERLRQDGVPLFFDADIQYTYDRSLGDGFSVRRDTVRLLDHGAGSVYPYDRATMQRDSERTGYIHTPQATARALSGYLDSLSAVGDVGLSLRHAGNKIAADYSEKQPADRQTALESLTAAVAQAAGQRSLMIGGANARILPYADICLDLPLTSSGSSLTDESVPFLPMVLSGYVRFTGTARSLEGDREGQLLHLAQTAGGLSYVLTAQNGREVTDGPCAFLYSTDFAYWRSDLLQTAVGYQSALDGLSGRRIVRYDRVGDGVYRTTFAGGATVTVNYGDSAVTVDGEPLSARSFTVRNGQEG